MSLCSALTVSMLFVLRRRQPGIWMPAYGIPAAIYVLATLVLAVLYGIGKPGSALAAALTLLVGVILYPLLRHRSTNLQDQ